MYDLVDELGWAGWMETVDDRMALAWNGWSGGLGENGSIGHQWVKTNRDAVTIRLYYR
jgi:hypothetical protein